MSSPSISVSERKSLFLEHVHNEFSCMFKVGGKNTEYKFTISLSLRLCRVSLLYIHAALMATAGPDDKTAVTISFTGVRKYIAIRSGS